MPDPLQPLESLYRAHAAALLAYFRAQRPIAAAAEDLLHDTFVRAARNLERVHAAASPRAYLFGIARHLVLDALRGRPPAAELIEEPAAELSADDPRLEPLRLAIAGLPPLQRETLLLKLQHDLSYAELADVLELPIGTIRSRLHHAVQQLRDTLKPRAEKPRENIRS